MVAAGGSDNAARVGLGLIAAGITFIASVVVCATLMLLEKPNAEELGQGTGASAIFLQVRLNRREDVDLGASRSIPQSYGVLYVLGGVLTAVVAQSNWLFVLLSSVILALCGITELVLGMRFRGQFPLGRDWTLCGAITVFAAMGMVLVETLGAKAELGVVGGAAILIGVTQLIAALSLRHDARVADGPAAGPAREA